MCVGAFYSYSSCKKVFSQSGGKPLYLNSSQTLNLKDSQVKPAEFAPKGSILLAYGRGCQEMFTAFRNTVRFICLFLYENLTGWYSHVPFKPFEMTFLLFLSLKLFLSRFMGLYK